MKKNPVLDYKFCTVCGGKMAERTEVVIEGYDSQTGEPNRRQTVYWACTAWNGLPFYDCVEHDVARLSEGA